MMTITIEHEGREPSVYKNVVGVDFIDKSMCESVAGRTLSKEELEYIENAICNCEYFPSDTGLEQIIEEMEV